MIDQDLKQHITYPLPRSALEQCHIRLTSFCQKGGDQIALATEMVIGGALGQARRFRDRVQNDNANSLSLKQSNGGPEDAFARRERLCRHDQCIPYSEYPKGWPLHYPHNYDKTGCLPSRPSWRNHVDPLRR